MKRLAILLLLALPLVFCCEAAGARRQAPPARGGEFSMSQAVERALAANPTVEARALALDQARMNVGVAQSYFWPRVSLVAGTYRIENYEQVQTYNSDNLTSSNWNKGMRASMSLFAGFQHLTNLQKSALAVEQEKARLAHSRLELACNVQLQFLHLLRAREELRSAKESVSRLEAQLKAASAFVREDMAPYVNVLQNETDLARARQQVIRVQNDIRNTEVQLNRFLGLGQNAAVRYVGRLADYGSEVGLGEAEAIATAEQKRPDLVIARKAVEMARKDMQTAMGQYLPRVDATYDNMSQSKDYDNRHYEGYTRNYWTAGLNFSWEVFSGGQTTFQTLSERKRMQSLKKDFEDALAGARSDVIRSLMDIDAARELIAASRKGVASARESYDMANRRYMTGIGTITEQLDAQARLTQAENDASQALAEFQSARARFFFHIGRENPGLR